MTQQSKKEHKVSRARRKKSETSEQTKPSESVRSEAELTALAIDFVTGKVFFCRPDEHEAAMAAFGMILALMDDKQVKVLAEANPQVLYEYHEKALPRGLNGYPMFASMSIVKASEWDVFRAAYNAKWRALYGDEKAEETGERYGARNTAKQEKSS